jgi:hypothetical protein
MIINYQSLESQKEENQELLNKTKEYIENFKNNKEVLIHLH